MHLAAVMVSVSAAPARNSQKQALDADQEPYR
jgi:hypothetical protein